MIFKIVGSLLLLAFVSAYLWLHSTNKSAAEAWGELAPNLIAEFLGIAASVIIAEILIRRYRASVGKREIAPLVLSELDDMLVFSNQILAQTGFTPRQFNAIMSDYMEGGGNPVHLPSDFRTGLVRALSTMEQEEFDAAIGGVHQAMTAIDKFPHIVEPSDIMLAKQVRDTWLVLSHVLADTNSSESQRCEMFVDAYMTGLALAQSFGGGK